MTDPTERGVMFVVVLEEKEPGVLGFPTMPGAEGLMRGVARAAEEMNGRPLPASRRYLTGGGSVLGFSPDIADAQRFASRADAQATIDRIPAGIRPAGLSVEEV